MQDDGRQKIIVTGIARRIGRLVARRLHRLGDFRIVVIDKRRVDNLPKDVEPIGFSTPPITPSANFPWFGPPN
jgi:NAD(P)-dependent dehydrogenase (short-subunit alcohol dehydrogenase family)